MKTPDGDIYFFNKEKHPFNGNEIQFTI